VTNKEETVHRPPKLIDPNILNEGDTVTIHAPNRHSHLKKGVVEQIFTDYEGKVRVGVRFKSRGQHEGQLVSYAPHEVHLWAR
jgi:quercetin dioxygenase-like cupin family protein